MATAAPMITTTQRPSAPMLARIALQFARNPKRIRKFATFINAKVNAPGLTEEQEQQLLERTIGVGLDAAAAAIEGRPVMSVASLRDNARDAVNFLIANMDEFDKAIDIPFVPDTVERWLTEEIKDALQNIVLPWIDSTPRLQ